MTAMAVISGQRIATRPHGPVRAQAAQLRVRCAAGEDKQARKAVLGLGALAGPALSHKSVALAAEQAAAEDLSKPLQQFVDVVDSAATFVDEATKVGVEVYKAAEGAATTAAPYVERSAKALKPLGETAGKLIEKKVAPVASDLASKGSQAASSAISGVVTEVDKTLVSQGLNVSVEGTVKTVATEAPKAVSAAKPVVTSTLEFLAKSDPTTLAEYALALYVVYLSRGLIGSFIGRQIRGFAGELTPPQTLDKLMADKSAVLVDLRTPDEVAAKGLLDLPKKQAKQVVVCERTTLSGGQFQNISDTETQVTAVKLASLKSIKKGKTVILLDQQGKQATRIAKELSSKGYGKVFIVKGGFLSWMDAQIKTKASFTARADALFVSRPQTVSSPLPRRQAAVDVTIDNPTPRRTPNKLGTVSGTVNTTAKTLPPGRK